jgi:predicted ATPase
LERGEQGGVQAIPPTLQQSLAARLDRLGPAREVAQIGAVLGRDFAYTLLRDIADLDEPALQAWLDRLADADLLFVEGAPPQATYRFKHALIQDAAYDSLLKSRRQTLHRRAAEVLRDDPERAAAESEVIAHHFTQAGLDDLAIEWWGKAGDQALRRSAFQEAISHLGKAIEMADKAGSTSTLPATATTASSSQRLRLQTSLGQAMMYSRGFGSEESKTAFARARTLSAGAGDATERFDAYYGLFIGSLLRGELSLARETAESFLRDAENEGRMTEAAVARRNVGAARLWQSDFIGAQTNLAEALRIYDPERDRDAKFRFGADAGAGAAGHLAPASWALGDVERARALSEEALARADETAHAPTRAFVYHHIALYQMFRGDPEAVRRIAKVIVDLGREHGMALWAALGEVHSSWARAWLGGRETETTELQRALAAYFDTGNKLFAPLFQGQLAELEAERNDADGALRRIDEALALANETGEHWTDALLHRIRGAILLKRDPANTAAAEEAFQTALAVAQAQKARSFELQAAISLAKLYRSTGRPADAHAVLAPALEGFSPTPEIVEAQALLAALADNDEVKAQTAQRERRLRLQLSYSRATMWSKGFAADETLAAYARARELAAEGAADEDRYAIYYGQWLGLQNRGELRQSRATAEAFLADAAAAGKRMETAVAHRALALNCFLLGEFAVARFHADRAIELDDPARSAESRFRFSVDCGMTALCYLALANWHLGEVYEASRLFQEALTQATTSGHVQTVANTGSYKAALDAVRGDAEAADRIASIVFALSREHGMEYYIAWSEMPLLWARSRLGDRAAEASKLRQAIANFMAGGHRLFAPFYTGLLAELDADGPDPNDAPAQIDAAIALAQQTGEHWADSMLHRVRGEILLKRDPANPAPTEEAFQTAIAVAKQQGTRSFGLRAALALAKLYQSTARPAEAHAILAPALEGFSPTAEMPEIAEAQSLLGQLSNPSAG